jgi:hypothetical protein
MNDLPAALPATLTVMFPLAAALGPDTPLYPVTVPLSSLALPGVPPSTPGYPGTHVLRSSALAGNDGTATPPNLAELTALASQMALDWCLWGLAPHDVSFAGVAPWQPDGLTDLVEWRQEGEDISTRARRGPWGSTPGAPLSHQGTRGSADDAPPSFLRVTGTTTTDGYYPAALSAWDTYARVWRDVPGAAPAWLDLFPAGAVTPAVDDVYPALPQGQRPADGFTVYLERATAASGGGGGGGGAGVVASGQTLEVQAGGTLLLDSGSILAFAGPAWNFTTSTTATVATATTLTLTGGSATTSVIDLTNIALIFDTGTTVIFNTSTVDLTTDQTWLLSTLTTWTVQGGSPATSTINWTDLTFKFDTTTTVVFHGPAVRLDLSQTWLITPGTAWLITGGSPTTSVINWTNLTQTFDSTSTIEWDGPAVNVTQNTTVNAGLGVTLTFGGNVNFTGTVTGAGGLLTSSATTYTGTTADPYGVVFDLVNSQGIHGSYVIKNTGASNSLQARATWTDMAGAVTTGAPFPVGVGQSAHFVVDTVASAATPIRELKLEVQSLSAGFPAAYSVVVSVTAAASLSVGNGGTGADLSGTGGPGMIASQPVSGGPLAVTTLGMDSFPRLAAQAMAVNSFR